MHQSHPWIFMKNNSHLGMPGWPFVKSAGGVMLLHRFYSCSHSDDQYRRKIQEKD
jgi:hypothetical protein